MQLLETSETHACSDAKAVGDERQTFIRDPKQREERIWSTADGFEAP